MTLKIHLKIIAVFIIHCVALTQFPDGEALIDSMLNSIESENSSALIEQVNEYSDGKTRTFQFQMFSGNKGEKTLMKYNLPTSVRGQTFLLLNDGDEIWTFSPRTRRVRKLASHFKKQKVQGSDFTFEDFSSQETWTEDYETETTGSTEYKNVPCWTLISEARSGADPDYPRIELLLRKTDYYPLLISYYLDDGTLEKKMEFSDIRDYGGIPNADNVTMSNSLTGTRTIMRTLEFDPNWVPEPGYFSERNLKK